MTHRITLNLNPGRKLLLAAAGLAMVALPVGIGLVNAPPSRAQAPASAAKTPGFEVASIKPGKTGGRGHSLLSDPSGRFTTENATLRNLVMYAYNVRDFQVSGGPRWMDSDTFDIVAKPQTRVKGEQLLQMVQTLLADRFKLKFHREARELSVFALVIGKNGPKLKEAKPDGERPMNGIQGGKGELNGLGADMGMLARRLAAMSGRTVIDRTGLTGKYDFKLQWTPDAPTPMRGPDEPAADNAPGPSLFSALQEQLGLKLESQKGPVEILVIDSAERPSENQP
jgi:uncharacterized protein (TIGR03435 family)